MKNLLLACLYATALLLGGCAGVPADDPNVQAKAKHDRRSAQEIATDKTIELAIYDDLNDADIKQHAYVQVHAYGRAVLVIGEAYDTEVKSKIIDKVRTTRNVKLVHDHLAIAHPSDAESRAQDKQTTDTIRSALAQIRTIPNFESAMVDMAVEQGVVYLLGRVHRDEGNVVINVVRHQPGIKKIVTLFEYLD